MTDIAARFAENLIVLRGRADLSQGRIAQRSGLHITEIGLLERGLRLPRLDTIVKLAGGIGVEPCVLLAGMKWCLGQSEQLPGAYVSHGELAAHSESA
ncbi:MAG TPA: helix-turn-helix transcriptional regulator [Solirubrobacterales bacterium]|nr:helix-turn-helix transcriptional regulator [Solirubrobacterales bacterium]